MRFDEIMNRLSVITEKMETGKLSLEESLQLYEEARGLIKKAEGMLDTTEQKVKLMQRGPDGAQLTDYPQDENMPF